MANRRNFLKFSSLAIIGSTLLGKGAFAADAAKPADGKVDESSPEAKGVNYRSTKAAKMKITDKNLAKETQGVKFADQACANCGLFQGKPGDKEGGCPIFGAKKVSAEGWCSTWNKKA